MNTMDIYALVWRINLHTPCYNKETIVRLTQLVSYIVAEAELHFTDDQAKKIVSDMNTSAFWHKGYYRKDKERTPYIVHPFEVVELLFVLGIFDYKLTVATIYHDNVEDENDKNKRYRKRKFITKNSGPAIRDIVELVTKSKRPHEKVQFFNRIRAEKRVAIAMRSCILKLADCAKNTETFDVFPKNVIKNKVEIVKREYPLLAKKAHQCIKKLSITNQRKEFLHRVTDELLKMIQKNISIYE